jgi:hypothetical protein
MAKASSGGRRRMPSACTNSLAFSHRTPRLPRAGESQAVQDHGHAESAAWWSTGGEGTEAAFSRLSAPNIGLQPTAYSLRVAALHSGFRQRLRPGVIAPRKAWRLLLGESPSRARASHPPVSRLASMAESGLQAWRTRWAKRRQRILEAVGVTAHSEVLGQLRKGEERTPRVFTLPKATRAPPEWPGGAGPPESSGRGMQEERCRRTWEAPQAPASAWYRHWARKGDNPPDAPGVS